MLVNNPVHAQEFRSIDTMVTKVEFRVTGGLKIARETVVHIHLFSKINGYDELSYAYALLIIMAGHEEHAACGHLQEAG